VHKNTQISAAQVNSVKADQCST